MIKKKRLIFLCILILLIIHFLYKSVQNSPKEVLKNLLKNEKLEGKNLKFVAKYFGLIPLGEVILKDRGTTDYQGRNVYLLSGEAETHDFFSFFFKAKAKIESFIDKENLHSLLFFQHLETSNKPDEDKKIIYDQKNHIMEFEGVKRVISPDTQDPLSAIFYMRRQDFEVGKVFDINLNTNQKNYRLLAKIIKRDEFKIDEKKIGIWILKADVRRRDKSPRHSSSFAIWFIDNPSKTPILIKAMTNIGSITARLIKIN